MKKLTLGIILSLFIGGAMIDEAPKLVNHVLTQIEQSGDQLIDSMTATIK